MCNGFNTEACSDLGGIVVDPDPKRPSTARPSHSTHQDEALYGNNVVILSLNSEQFTWQPGSFYAESNLYQGLKNKYRLEIWPRETMQREEAARVTTIGVEARSQPQRGPQVYSGEHTGRLRGEQTQHDLMVDWDTMHRI